MPDRIVSSEKTREIIKAVAEVALQLGKMFTLVDVKLVLDANSIEYERVKPPLKEVMNAMYRQADGRHWNPGRPVDNDPIATRNVGHRDVDPEGYSDRPALNQERPGGRKHGGL